MLERSWKNCGNALACSCSDDAAAGEADGVRGRFCGCFGAFIAKVLTVEDIDQDGAAGREAAGARIGTLSGGQKQSVWRWHAHWWAIRDSLFLDEPTTGLDPQCAQAALVDLMDELRSWRVERSFLTTHYMDEGRASVIAWRSWITGRIIALGTPKRVDCVRWAADHVVEFAIATARGSDRGAREGCDSDSRSARGTAWTMAGCISFRWWNCTRRCHVFFLRWRRWAVRA